ncbi:MAG: hypothetical protein FWF51_08170 [Chitinivibrionia bacterium]|nr:hypothetical protein [Chitinivibrionia bacterium]
MFEQVLIPSKDNATITLPSDFYGLEVKVTVIPIKMPKTKDYPWISGNSGIDNPVKVGKNFIKYSREELYDR